MTHFWGLSQSIAQSAELIIPKGHTTPVTLLDYQEKARWLASSPGNNSYTIWNFDAEKEIRQVSLHDNPITALAFHPSFSQSISADGSGRIITYDIRRNRKRSDRIIHSGPVKGILFDADAEHFFTFSADSTIKKINYSDFRIMLDIQFEDKVSSIEYSEEKNLLLVSVNNGKVITVNDKGVKKNLINEDQLVFRDLIHTEGPKYLGVTEMGEIAHIDLSSEKVSSKGNIPFKVKKSLRVDSLLFLAGRGPGDLGIFNINTLEGVKKPMDISLKKELDPFNISLQTIYADIDSAILFIPDYDYSIIAYDLKKNKLVRRFKGFTERIREIDFSPNGYSLAVASQTNGVRLYDLREVIDQSILENSSPAYSVDYSPNGLLLASAKEDSLIIYSTDFHKEIRKYPLKGVYPNGLNDFLSNDKFIKKDERDGLTVFDIYNNSAELLKVKEAFEFKSAFPQDYFLVKSGSNKIFIYETEGLKKKAKIKTGRIIDFDVAPFANQIVVIHKDEGLKLSLFDNKGKLIKESDLPDHFDAQKIKILDDRSEFLSWKVSVTKSGEEADYNINLWSLDSLKHLNTFTGLQSAITSVSYDSKRGYVIASSEDGSIKIWPVENNQLNKVAFPASIFPLNGTEIVTMMNNGVFDATRNAIENMHYVQGAEYISLDQIKEKYYEPKLLSKIFAYNQQTIRSREAIDHFELYPEIKLQHPAMNGGILGVDLEERGGGIGDVFIYINNKKAKEYDSEEESFGKQIKYSVEGHPFLKPNEINEISVKASNAAGDVVSGPNKIKYIWNSDSPIETKKLYALIVGVSDYAGNKLDLNFSSKDAQDISEAIKRGAGNYFGSENVHILNLNSLNTNKNFQPSKRNTIHAIKEISDRIKPQDVFLFYFAGHGMQGKGEDKNFYLLTQEASYQESIEMDKPSEFSISDRELAESLSKISSHNMIMILDACHSGEMINKFKGGVGHISTNEERALEKLISETGLHILAGSESDDVSYETSLYGQGLLTYSLLFGMKGEGLRDGKYLDVNLLFQYASSKVPELASTVGGVQKPVVKLPKGMERVDIGEYSNSEKSQIDLISPRPILLPSTFQDNEMYLDVKSIGLQLDDKLKFQAEKTGLDYIFLNSNNFSGSYKLSGRYFQNLNGIKMIAKVYRDAILIDKIEIEEANLDLAIEKIAGFGLSVVENDFKKRN